MTPLANQDALQVLYILKTIIYRNKILQTWYDHAVEIYYGHLTWKLKRLPVGVIGPFVLFLLLSQKI